jgi:predicted acylesterase/phospholipase RssA
MAEREHFRATLPLNVSERWKACPSRIGVVLSGGGARGAYEAGVLLAMQDAGMPTHILTATSVGSINAASYAGHSETVVGNAESLVASWADLTPAAVGIDWFRYILVLAGLIAASAGFGNLFREALHQEGVYLHLMQPKLTWFALGLTGTAILFLYDQASYLGYVLQNQFSGRHWKPNRKKVTRSIIANVIVWGCAAFFLQVAHLHVATTVIINESSDVVWLCLAAVALLAALGYYFRNRISVYSHQFLRLPLRSGLFPNFERTRYLRSRIPAGRLRRSPIRVVMTAADVTDGVERFFTNFKPEEIADDPGVNLEFIQKETVHASKRELLLAVIASSAFPIVYEAVPLYGKLWTDGGIVSNQPIRPAIRLGAQVLFLVMVEPRVQRRNEIKTFLDLGVRALDILMSQNLKNDLRILNNVNGLCEQYAAKMGVKPEQIVLHIGPRRYRYLKAISVEPSEELAAAVLDFDGRIIGPAIVQGYRDGARAVHSFLDYLASLPPEMPRMEVRLVPDEAAARASASK